MSATATNTRQGVREAAAGYLERGWVPVPLRGKAPIVDEWQRLTRDRYDLDVMFPAGRTLGVGVLLGEPSGGLVDVDLDCAEARAAAVVLLPETGMVWGRQSAPDSHYGYTVPDPPLKASDKFDDPLRSGKGARLCELRSTGGQTVMPPSIYPADPKDGHPSEEPCVWSAAADPSRVALVDLRRQLGRVAAAALLGRYWREDFRHDSAMALAGGLLRTGWSVDDTVTFVEAVVSASGDSECRDRVRTVRDTADTLAAGDPVTGWPTLAKLLGDRGETIVARVREWIGVRPGVGPTPSGNGKYKDVGGDDAQRPTGVRVGELTLRAGLPRMTASGRLTVPVDILRGATRIDHITLTSSPGSRSDAARLIAGHLGTGGPARSEIDQAFGELLAIAASKVAQKSEITGPLLRDTVRSLVPAALHLTHRTDRGLWSEARGSEMTRADLIAFTPEKLLEAAAQAADAPQGRGALLAAVRVELEVLAADLTGSLPRLEGADLKSAPTAAERFRSALVALWTAARTFEVTNKGTDNEVASRTSLARRAREAATRFPDPAPRWQEAQRALDAWWRRVELEGGEIVTLLAMRWTLTGQVGVILPGVTDQASLVAIGRAAGCIDPEPRVPDRLTGGHRLAVLSRPITDEILTVAEPEDTPSSDGPTVTEDRGCH